MRSSRIATMNLHPKCVHDVQEVAVFVLFLHYSFLKTTRMAERYPSMLAIVELQVQSVHFGS